MSGIHGQAPPLDLTPESREHAIRRVGLYLQFLNPGKPWSEMKAEAEALVDEYNDERPRRGPREGSARFL